MMVKIIADSISQDNVRITTFHLRYWRAIHAELMTHREMSRNARSSRAVPSITLLNEEIFTPQFGMNKSGMQSEILASPELQEKWAGEWQNLAQMCRDQVRQWQSEGMHKQWANRPLEWFGWIDVLVTATRWNNFYALRISEYAQPEFDLLARAMQYEQRRSEPKLLLPGEWHLPYIFDDELASSGVEACRKLSVARCARLSYVPFEGEGNHQAEFARYEKLVVSRPVHASPAEHQATPDSRVIMMRDDKKIGSRWAKPKLHGNFHGWIQFRKTLPHEYVQ